MGYVDCRLALKTDGVNQNTATMEVVVQYRRAVTADLPACISIRGRTRDNPLSAEHLASSGVTPESWSSLMDSQQIHGFVAEGPADMVGFCFGDQRSGEVLVLAVLPDFEGEGIGRKLLDLTTETLFSYGRRELWLAASPSPDVRAHGFYRRLGWTWRGETDDIGDQILLFDR